MSHLNLPPPTKFTTNLTNPRLCQHTAAAFIIAPLLPSSSRHCFCLRRRATAAFLVVPPLPSSSRRRCLHRSAAGAPPLPSSSRCWFYLRRRAPATFLSCHHCLPRRAAVALIVTLLLPSSSRRRFCLRRRTAAPFIIAPLVVPSLSRPRCLPFTPPLLSFWRLHKEDGGGSKATFTTPPHHHYC